MTGPVRVVVHPRHPRGVAEAFAAVDGIDLALPTLEDLDDALEDCDVLVTWVWSDDYHAPRLRWIQSISAGVDQFPLLELEDRGIALTSASGLHVIPVAEHAFALLLALTRGIGLATRNATTATWRPHMNEELAGKTMLVLGLGTIGEEIAKRAVAWGMKVVGIKQNVGGYSGAAEEVRPPEDLDELAERADVIVAVLPDTEATRGIVDRGALKALGPGWFINVGRGSVVSEADLLWAIEECGLRGAGLDVFEREPLPENSPLWSHPRVVLTPHTAGLSPMYGPRLAEIFRANLLAFHGRGDWVNRVV
jgi:phosphoglycerate dehydrogenase-like enzyme